MTNIRGLNTDLSFCNPKWTKNASPKKSFTLPRHQDFRYIDCKHLTNHSSTPSLIKTHQTTSTKTWSKALSKSANGKYKGNFLMTKILSLVLLGMKPNYILYQLVFLS